VLVQEYMAFSMVHNITCTVKCKWRTAVTMYRPTF
jgi:hypothetical protein